MQKLFYLLYLLVVIHMTRVALKSNRMFRHLICKDMVRGKSGFDRSGSRRLEIYFKAFGGLGYTGPGAQCYENYNCNESSWAIIKEKNRYKLENLDDSRQIRLFQICSSEFTNKYRIPISPSDKKFAILAKFSQADPAKYYFIVKSPSFGLIRSGFHLADPYQKAGIRKFVREASDEVCSVEVYDGMTSCFDMAVDCRKIHDRVLVPIDITSMGHDLEIIYGEAADA